MIITITGRSGSGKTTLCEYLKQKKTNICFISTDQIGHNILNQPKIKKQLVDLYSENILTNEDIDRKKLRPLVKNNLDMYNKVIHPILRDEINKCIRTYDKTNDNIIIDSALIKEFDLQNISDIIILIKRDIPDNEMAKIQEDFKSPDFIILNTTKNHLFEESIKILDSLKL
ncbi:dephospho-CoA kinase [Candidatus Woesearchaeota archaeon]|nr:dephospho-CoA kinase [Candidatus Woesearchaeota archaeon]